MTFSSSPKSVSSSQQACEDLIRFLSDFSVLMGKHLDVVSRSLTITSEGLAAGAEAISSTSRANIERADQFELRNPETKSFEPVRISRSDPLFIDPVGFARPVNESMAMHMAGVKILEASLEQFVSTFSVVRSVDSISIQRLQKAVVAMNAINEAMQETLVQYRLHGSLSEDFVDRIKAKMLSALSADPGYGDKHAVFKEFLGR